MLVISVSPDTADDMLYIQSYIAAQNPSSAERVIRKITEAMELLAQNPDLGHIREDLTEKSFRFWQVYRYSIIYSHTSEELRIHRVISNYRDAKTILKS